MLELKVNSYGRDIQLNLQSQDGNQPSALVLEPSSDEAESIVNDLNRSYGAFGHTIDPKNVTPIDLHAALTKLGYRFEVIRGGELIETYDPKIPEGALT